MGNFRIIPDESAIESCSSEKRAKLRNIGIGQLIIALIFSGSVAIPCSEITWPRYVTDFFKNSHLDPLSFKP
jgi:hypothetical protein